MGLARIVIGSDNTRIDGRGTNVYSWWADITDLLAPGEAGTYRIDVEQTAALLEQTDPELIIFGKSMVLHPEPVDEIHRLSPVVEEVLYPAMEDYQLDIVIGEGPAARSIKVDLPPFTLVGATTRAGLLTSPLRDRFGIVQRLEFYSAEDLGRIVMRSAELLEIHLEADGASQEHRNQRHPLGRHVGCRALPATDLSKPTHHKNQRQEDSTDHRPQPAQLNLG